MTSRGLVRGSREGVSGCHAYWGGAACMTVVYFDLFSRCHWGFLLRGCCERSVRCNYGAWCCWYLFVWVLDVNVALPAKGQVRSGQV